MQLKQSLIHRSYEKCAANIQATIGEDYSIPEGKPDVSKILQKKAGLLVDEVHTEKGKIRVRGSLQVKILYLAERSSKTVDSLMAGFPFEEVLYMEGAESGDNLKIDWDIEELRVNIIHPGKVGVRSIVVISAEVTGMERHLITEAVEGEVQIFGKTETVITAEPFAERNDSYRIREEVSLPANKPNVQDVIWDDLKLQQLELRIQEEKLFIKGELQLFVLYESEEPGGNLQWMEQKMPVQGYLEVPGIKETMFGSFKHEIAHCQVEVKPDFDGEMRSFQMEMLLNIHMHIYEEQKCRVLKDAYSTRERLQFQKKEVTYEKLRMCNQTKWRVNGVESLEEDAKVLQLLTSRSRLQGKRSRLTEQGILCEGVLETEIMYVSASDKQPFSSFLVRIPYSQTIENTQIEKEDVWKVFEELDQIQVSMQDGNRVEIRGTLGFSVCVMEQCCLENIEEIIQQPYSREEYEKIPGMTIHFVQQGESLWSIAKDRHMAMETIKKQNDLTVEEVVPGQKLILLKPIFDEM